ncbi:MAG: hypothetical protein KC729_21350, partial [Candidatus Eisenbacteria bacterium]|nr:hypothetical protein [Candidatus Eisenbacteria bacterium]
LDVLGVFSLTGLVYAIREAVTIPLKLARQSLDIYTGPAALLSPDVGLIFKIAQMLDLFDLYRMFLVIVGLAVVGHVSTKRSAGVVLAFWGLWVVIQIGYYLSPLGALSR